jgi:hypothetical protein
MIFGAIVVIIAAGGTVIYYIKRRQVRQETVQKPIKATEKKNK